MLGFPWLVISATFTAGWFISHGYGELARRCARSVFAISILVLLALAISGAFHDREAARSFHRWTAHGITIFLWLAIPFAIAVLLQQNFRRRPSAAIAQLIALLLVFGSTVLCAFTGYLWPTGSENAVGEETLNRFLILHLFVFPATTFALCVESYWYFGRTNSPAPSDSSIN